MLECRGVIKPLPEGDWQVQLASGSLIPFITNGKDRHWCMTFFQSKGGGADSTLPSEGAPNLDLSSITASDGKESTTPVAPRVGMQTGHFGFLPGKF